LALRGEGFDLVAWLVVTGGHRMVIEAVASGRADVAAIDCKSWALAQRHHEAASALIVVGWTGRRKGLPFVSAFEGVAV
ncbi:MAG: phosphate ABC transporter substrate-binding protein, partial [Phyllobacterium sp.]|nr:phosphate ABC transporter substrate-binding protein [Phyllobacterium sp.]